MVMPAGRFLDVVVLVDEEEFEHSAAATLSPFASGVEMAVRDASTSAGGVLMREVIRGAAPRLGGKPGAVTGGRCGGLPHR